MKDKLLVAGEKGKAEDKINGKSNCKESCNKSKTKFKTCKAKASQTEAWRRHCTVKDERLIRK